MWKYQHQLQLLPKPPLPKMPRTEPRRLDTNTGNRTASCALFSRSFTLPEVLNKTALHEPKMLYDILFESAWETLQTFGKTKSPNGNDCCFAHLGTNLSLHPHLHCIVPSGGVDENGAWKNIKNDGKFLFSVKALSKVFRAKFCEKLKANLKDKFNENQENEYEKIRQSLWEKPWVVFTKTIWKPKICGGIFGQIHPQNRHQQSE